MFIMDASDATKSTITLMKMPPIYYYFYVKHLDISGDMFSHLQVIYIQYILEKDILEKNSDAPIGSIHREPHRTVKTRINNNNSKD